MKKAEINDMELGNLIFGNSRGEYAVEPRTAYQDLFVGFRERCGFDLYMYHDLSDDDGVFENDVFRVRPYYWGEDESIAVQPNFVYKPTGLEIRWYKYPMRDAYSNQDISLDAFAEILAKCERSMEEGA